MPLESHQVSIVKWPFWGAPDLLEQHSRCSLSAGARPLLTRLDLVTLWAAECMELLLWLQQFRVEIWTLELPARALTDPLSFSSLQIDLEPEGKVYVIIDLSGSSGEGRRA